MSSGQFTEHISVNFPTEIIQVSTGMERKKREKFEVTTGKGTCTPK
jgi:hypothetical protein